MDALSLLGLAVGILIVAFTYVRLRAIERREAEATREAWAAGRDSLAEWFVQHGERGR